MSDYIHSVSSMPRIKFVCGRSVCFGPGTYEIGAFWCRNFKATEGELIYKHCFVVHFRLLVWVWRS